MTPIRILAPALVACALASCASQKADQYDTTNPYGAAAEQASAPVNEPANPVYDTPAAYEETSATAANAASTDAYVPSASPNIPAAPSAAAPAAPSNGAAIIHTVVAGDTLSGIASKYKVSTASIKQANNMTRDIVVLGKKMVIPPAR